MTKTQNPCVFDFLDLCAYLQAYYRYRKSVQSSFSYESWATQLDFKKSRSFLRMIVIGKKKAPPGFVEAFSQSVFETQNEKEYFAVLVRYSQATTTIDKNLYGNKLIQIIRMNTGQKQIQNFSDFVSDPLLPRLLTLASFKDIDSTSATYARLLNITIDRAEAGMKALENLELVESSTENGQTHWRALSDRFKVSDHKGDFDLMKFHEKSLNEAIDAFDKPLHLRMYKSLLLAMNEQELQVFCKNLNDFAAEQISRFTPNEYSDRKVFQLNFNHYPVTN